MDLQIGGQTRSMVRERLATEPRLGNLVELGCGTGFYTRALAARADRVKATDLAPAMLALARERTTAANVAFQVEDCQKTSFPAETFDTAFMSLVIHFTEPATALAEMRRILKAGGRLIIANLDLPALKGLDRARCLARILFRGLIGYRARPPRGFGRNVLSEHELVSLLDRSGFRVLGRETFRDQSRSSNIPVNYVTAVSL